MSARWITIIAWLGIGGCWSTASSPPPSPAGASAAPLPSGPYATRALAGPYPTRAAWCADLPPRLQRRFGGPDLELTAAGCTSHAPLVTRGPTQLGPSGGAITKVELAAFQVDPSELWGPHCALLLHTARGIWVHEDLGYCLAPAGATSIVTSLAIDALTWQDVIDRGPRGEALGKELVLRATMVRSTPQQGIDETATTMIVCGAGASATPRCTPAIPVKRDQDPFSVDYRPAISANGALRFELEDHGEMMDDDAHAELALEHSLRFP